MPGFNYTAIDRNGKRVRSSLDASSIETAKSSLRGAGYTILDIKEQTTLNRDIEIPFLGKPKAKDMAVFCRQFVSILRAGVSVASVLAMLGQQTSNKKLRAAIREMQADVEKGESLATSMRRHPKIFPAILVNMVAAGESSGNLEESFRQMELYFERSKRTKSKVTSAMIYPCVLIVVMIVVLIVMMTKIIPNFLKTFEDMDAELPKLTQGVMAVCEWFESWRAGLRCWCASTSILSRCLPDILSRGFVLCPFSSWSRRRSSGRAGCTATSGATSAPMMSPRW